MQMHCLVLKRLGGDEYWGSRSRMSHAWKAGAVGNSREDAIMIGRKQKIHV